MQPPVGGNHSKQPKCIVLSFAPILVNNLLGHLVHDSKQVFMVFPGQVTEHLTHLLTKPLKVPATYLLVDLCLHILMPTHSDWG